MKRKLQFRPIIPCVDTWSVCKLWFQSYLTRLYKKRITGMDTIRGSVLHSVNASVNLIACNYRNGLSIITEIKIARKCLLLPWLISRTIYFYKKALTTALTNNVCNCVCQLLWYKCHLCSSCYLVVQMN